MNKRILGYLNNLKTKIKTFRSKKKSFGKFEAPPSQYDPTYILGDDYGDPIQVESDELSIEFVSFMNMVVGDDELLTRYMNSDLTSEEKEKYPYHYRPCTVMAKDLEETLAYTIIANLTEEAYGLFVVYQNVYGILIYGQDIATEMNQRIYRDKEVDSNEELELTFMRFDPALIRDVDFDWTAQERYRNLKMLAMPELRVCFK